MLNKAVRAVIYGSGNRNAGPSIFSFVSASNDSVSLDISSQTITPFDVYLTADGTKLYVNKFTVPSTIYQYNLSTPNDITSATFTNSKSVDVGGTVQYNMWFKPDGTKLYTNDIDTIFQYTLSVPWDITTATYDTVSFDIATANISSIQISPDGSSLFVSNTSAIEIKKYTLTVPWSIGAVVPVSNYDYSAVSDLADGAFISKSGTRMMLLVNEFFSTTKIKDFSLSIPFDPTSATLVTTYDTLLTDGFNSTLFGVTFTDDEQKAFFIETDETTNINVRQFSTPSD